MSAKGKSAANRLPSKDDLDRILVDIFNEVILDGERTRLQQVAGYWRYAIEDDEDEGDEEYTPFREEPEDAARHWQACLQVNDLDRVRPMVERMLAERGFTIPSFDKIYLRQATANVAAAYAVDAERERGIYRPTTPPYGPSHGVGIVGAVAPLASAPDTPPQMLSAAYVDYVDLKEKSGAWKADQAKHARGALTLWLAFRGDMAVDKITKRDAVAFRAQIMKLPALRHVAPYKGLEPDKQATLREKFEKAEGEAAKDNAKAIAVAGRKYDKAKISDLAESIKRKTANKYMDPLNGFLKDLGYYGGSNPFFKVRWTPGQCEEEPVRKVLESDESVVIPWLSRRIGGAGCGRRKTGGSMSGMGCAIRVT